MCLRSGNLNFLPPMAGTSSSSRQRAGVEHGKWLRVLVDTRYVLRLFTATFHRLRRVILPQ